LKAGLGRVGETLSQKQSKSKCVLGVAQEVEWLPQVREDLGASRGTGGENHLYDSVFLQFTEL
jgi:hypothetical protein